MANQDREKARRMASRGATAQEIRQATGLRGDAARTVVAGWSPGAQAAAPPTVQQVRQATGTNRSQAAAIAARVAPVSTNTNNTNTNNTNTDNTNTDNTNTAAGGINPLDAYLAAQGAELQTRSAISNYGWDAQKVIAQLQDAGQTERQKLVNENNLAVTAAEVKGKLDLQGIINAGYKNIANIERGSNMFSSLMGAFNF